MNRNHFLMMMMGLGISFSAQAEIPIVTLSQIEGVVLVNQGNQFARAHNGMSLSEGDRILTMKESQVALRSESYGCSSFMQENALLTITEDLNCETLTRQETEPLRYAAVGDVTGGEARAVVPGGSGAAGAAGGVGGVSAIGGMGTLATVGTIVGIGAAVGIGVGVGLAVTGDDEPSISAQ